MKQVMEASAKKYYPFEKCQKRNVLCSKYALHKRILPGRIIYHILPILISKRKLLKPNMADHTPTGT